MKKHTRLRSFAALLCTALFSLVTACTDTDLSGTQLPATNSDNSVDTQPVAERPNILLIVADDMGYSDIGAFGGEIETPNLDALADNGVKLTQFYAAPSCSPTRAMLLSGVDNHLAGLGTMKELIQPNQAGQPGYEGYLNHRVVSMATLLQNSGYHTYMTGKWHLGLAEDTSPSARGFQKTFALLHGGSNHFDMRGMEIRDPVAEFRENGQHLDALPDEFGYSSDFYTQKIIEHIDSNRNDEQPFFAYLAFTAPHWPLQAPPEYIEKYAGRYDKGYEALREQRLLSLKKQGIVASDVVLPPLPEAIKPWKELTPDQKRVEARKMEIYAAMVDNLDVNVGRLVTYLRRIGEFDNTLIFFMSDNGADAGDVLKKPQFVEWIARFDNRYESMGSADSFVDYGPQWAHAATVPYRLWKTYTTEGGFRVPAFLSYPKATIKGVAYSDITNVVDVLPTFLELAGISHPGKVYQQREITPISGKSMLPLLYEKTVKVHGENYYFGFELFGRRALRKGDWKLVWTPQPSGPGDWELYNISQDPGELNDLADTEHTVMNELTLLFQKYEQEHGVIYPQGVLFKGA